MEIFSTNALSQCIREAVRAELQQHFKTGGNHPPESEKLLSKQELAAELGVSLVTLTDWMKKGLPYLRLHNGCTSKKVRYSMPWNKLSKIKGG
ncbi:hypothetical protein ACVW0P_004463 [Mucilaginibacter sp. UYNi724]